MRILGIEFGTWSLKAVEMESRFRRVEVLDFHEVRLPLQLTDPTAEYKAALEQLLARLPSYPDKVVTSLPPAQTALRFLPIPVKARKKVEQMFRFELEDSVPFKLDDSIVEHSVSRTKEGSVVFAAIAPKKHILTHIEWLRAVGVDPDWLTFEGMGAINLYLSSVPKKKDEQALGPVLLLDIGHLKTNIAVFDADRLELFRSIAWGGASVTQAIAISLGISLEEAERYKMNELRLTEENDKLSDAAREAELASEQALGAFITDISHTLVSFRNLYRQEIASVVITGGTSKLRGMQAYLAGSLDLPVNRFLTFDAAGLKTENKSADPDRFAEPLGRAMVFARKGSLLFNFRQQDVGKGTSLTEISAVLKDPNVIRLMRFVSVLAAILFVHVFVSKYLAEKEARSASEELRKAFATTFPNVPSKLKMSLTTSPTELKKFIDQKNNEMEQKMKMLSKGRVPMMGLIRTISEAFGPDLKVDVNTLQLDDRTFMMEGVVYAGDLNKVTENLKKIASLNKVALQRDGQRFTYKGEVVGR